jgi:hydroxymethylglutaryl-CoA synthase
MRGIVSYGIHVPYRRLDRAEIKRFLGRGGGAGTRAVASYDEDTTTMAVEAGRAALAGVTAGPVPTPIDDVWLATADPAYLEKTNAAALHAALRLDTATGAFDFGGAVRSGSGALLAALRSSGATLVVASDRRGGLPGSVDEAAGGDAAVAVLVGDDTVGPLLAEVLATASTTAEFLDRWRTPGEARTRQWEEKFGEVQLVPLAEEAWNAALKRAGCSPAEIDRVTVCGPHARAVKSVTRKLGVDHGAVAPDLTGLIGQTGAAHPGLALAAMLDGAEPGQRLAVVSLADGADVIVARTTDALATFTPARPVTVQIQASGALDYARFLSWRGQLPLDPPRRPEPARMSASAAARGTDWKYGFTASRDRASGAMHLPPARVSMVGGAVDDMESMPMAESRGTVVTFTVDRMAYSPSPPVIFAVVDFDDGGRLPLELTDVDESEVGIGTRVEMTFRRLNSADGIHNYFWKARPVRG